LGARRRVSILDLVNLPKGKIGKLEFTGKTSRPLPILDDGKPVNEFVIFAPGTNDSDYGPVEFDQIAAACVMTKYAEKANPLYFDFNHGMATRYATAEQGKSAGTFELAVRDGALMAVNCKWTEEAYERISKREYNLFSPWLEYIDCDDGVRRVYQLHNVAILNLAALNGINQLAAGAAATQENDMTAEEIKRLTDRITTLEAENGALRAAGSELVSIGKTLQLGASAGVHDISRSITGLLELRADVLTLTGQDNVPGAVGVLEAYKAKAGQADELVAKAAKAESDAIAVEMGAVLDAGITAGKLSPGMRDIFEQAGLAKGGGKPSKEGVAYLTAKLGAMSKQVSTEETAQKRAPAEVTPVTKVVAVQMGVNMDDLELFKTDRPAWEAKVRDRAKLPVAKR
jgi:phage I-like protein